MTATSATAALGWVRSAVAGGPSDGQLLERFAAGRDEAAFAELVRRHGPRVLGVCRRVTGHDQDAEEAFQATFLALAHKAAALAEPALLASWLHGVAHHKALKARATADRLRAKERTVEGAPHPTEEPDPVRREALAELDRELAALPEPLRAAVILCELEGRPRKEAARELRVPEGTLSSRLAAARRRLAERLRRRGQALPGAVWVAAWAGGAPVPAALAARVAQAAAVPTVAQGWLAA